MNSADSSSLVASAVARPFRIAFLVHEEAGTLAELTQIARYSAGCWGGAFHGVFPTNGLRIPDPWWPLLRALDPDVIYSLTPIGEELTEELSREICPARLIQIDARDRERFGPDHLIRDHHIGAAGCYRVAAAIWQKRDVLQPPQFANLRDHWRADLDPDQLFAVLNFGSLPGTVASDAAFRDLPATQFNLDEIDVPGLLEADISPRRLLMPFDVAASEVSPPLNTQYDPWAEDCHVVVGDHLFDLLYLSSRRLIASRWHGRSTAWLPVAFLEGDRLEQVARWLSKAYWHGGQGLAKVVSYSIDSERLEAVRAAIARVTRWPVRSRRFEVPELPLPESIRHQPAPKSEPQHLGIVDDKILISYRTPEFLHGASAGGVMLDATIQFRPEQYAYTNVRPEWRLPRRLDLARLFFAAEGARVTATGLPSVVVSPNDASSWAGVPTDRSAIWACIERRSSIVHRRDAPVAGRRFREFYTSKSGLQLQGLLRILGGIYPARRLFEDYYWHRVLLRLAGVERDAIADRTSRVERLISGYFNGGGNEITATDGGSLAAYIGRRFFSRRERPGPVTMATLQNWFGVWRSEEIQGVGPAADWWRHHESFDDWRRSELSGLLEGGVLEQGCTVTCRACGSPNWYSANRLAAKVMCPGCASETSLQVGPEWSFRVNSLLADALDREGALAMLLVLVELQQLGNEMFLFLPPQDIFGGTSRSPFTDVDLAFIRGGKFGIAEIKSSPIGFDSAGIERIAAVAEDWQPDIVLLAAPGPVWPAEVSAEFDRLAERLRQRRILVKPWLLSWEYPRGVLEF